NQINEAASTRKTDPVRVSRTGKVAKGARATRDRAQQRAVPRTQSTRMAYRPRIPDRRGTYIVVRPDPDHRDLVPRPTGVPRADRRDPPRCRRGTAVGGRRSI